MPTLRRTLGRLRRRITRRPAAAAPRPSGVDYEGAWGEYAQRWRERHPGLAYLGDEWTGAESGAAGSVEEYMAVIEKQYVAPFVSAGDAVLEIGVGGGRTAVLLRAHAAELICADISADMLEQTRKRLGTDGVSYVKLDGRRLDGIPDGAVDVVFCFDTLVHLEPRDIYNYLTRIPRLTRGKRLCVLHHGNTLTERGWQRFLGEWEGNLMGRRHARSFSVMTDSIMERFLTHLGYDILVKDTRTVPRDCVWVVRAPSPGPAMV